MDTHNQITDLLERIERLEKQVAAHQTMILGLHELIKTMPQPGNLAELGRYLAIIKGNGDMK